MGRSKLPIITKEDGTAFFAKEFEIGKADVVKEGTRATIVASGPMVARALEAAENLGGDIEVIAVSSFVPFDNETVAASVKKTGKVVTVHDHHIRTGLGSFVLRALADAGVSASVKRLGVKEYQLSGKPDELYENTGLSVKHIEEAVQA